MPIFLSHETGIMFQNELYIKILVGNKKIPVACNSNNIPVACNSNNVKLCLYFFGLFELLLLLNADSANDIFYNITISS